MLIRRETPADIPAVTAVTAAAFAKPDTPVPVEVTLLDALRGCPGWIPALSLVATRAVPDGDGLTADTDADSDAAADADATAEVIGHVVCTRGHLDGVPAVGLGPISVRPDRQNRGVGHALMHTALGAADALGEPFVALLGSPAYYARYGFRASTAYGIDPPDPAWGAYFQVRTLSTYEPALRGTFTYAEPFSDI
ncbi:N-acetyltransferase [Streptomyces armeniacus]|uniref:N-acetyltransferase n=1 Tax=Streptomyces armeniacus TaxID=83291 RepID=A0A345XKX1_9ACTN|nr:N-acetyltransferase [Streptomyces armeniacus]AXK32287.1 N-acetyltransferase [Streptomyces armeniacus]